MKMKRPRNGDFWLCLVLNIVFNWEWTIPAWVLLVLHFVLNWSIWWFVLALSFWLISILLWMAIMSWAARCSHASDPPKANKNPYSATSKTYPTENGDQNDARE